MKLNDLMRAVDAVKFQIEKSLGDGNLVLTEEAVTAKSPSD